MTSATSGVRFAAAALMILSAATTVAGCAGEPSAKPLAGAASSLKFIDAHNVDIAGVWEGEASVFTVDSGPLRSKGRYEITAPADGVLTVHETLTLPKPAELQEGAPLMLTRKQDLFGVISPDGSIRMVKLTDNVVFEGWFTDKDTLQLVFTESGPHAVVGTRTATRVAG